MSKSDSDKEDRFKPVTITGFEHRKILKLLRSMKRAWPGEKLGNLIIYALTVFNTYNRGIDEASYWHILYKNKLKDAQDNLLKLTNAYVRKSARLQELHRENEKLRAKIRKSEANIFASTITILSTPAIQAKDNSPQAILEEWYEITN